MDYTYRQHPMCDELEYYTPILSILQYYNIRISRPMLVRMNRIKGMLS